MEYKKLNHGKTQHKESKYDKYDRQGTIKHSDNENGEIINRGKIDRVMRPIHKPGEGDND